MGRPKILLVDDNSSMIEAEKEILKEFNFEIFTAMDGVEAIKLINTVKPFLVFLDLMLPNMNGDAICSYIKNSPQLKDIAVIIVTAKNDPNYLERCFRSGCDAYVVKPIEKDDIIKKVKIIMQEKGIEPY